MDKRQRTQWEIHPFLACQAGNVDLAKLLLSKGANPESGGTDFIPLHISCFRGHLEIVKLLLAHGADVTSRRSNGQTPLLAVVHDSRKQDVRLEIAKMLVSRHPKLVRLPNIHGIYPIHWSSGKGQEKILQFLLDKGVDINAKDKNGYTALHYITRWWGSDLSLMLIKKGIDINATDNQGQTPFMLPSLQVGKTGLNC